MLNSSILQVFLIPNMHIIPKFSMTIFKVWIASFHILNFVFQRYPSMSLAPAFCLYQLRKQLCHPKHFRILFWVCGDCMWPGTVARVQDLGSPVQADSFHDRRTSWASMYSSFPGRDVKSCPAGGVLVALSSGFQLLFTWSTERTWAARLPHPIHHCSVIYNLPTWIISPLEFNTSVYLLILPFVFCRHNSRV